MTKKKHMDPVLEYSRRMARILYAIEYLGRYCEICKLDGFSAPWLMDFHHRDEKTKKYEVKNKLYGGSFANHKEEIDKCMLICVSCHRTQHAKSERYKQHQVPIFERLEELRKNGTGMITKNHFLTEKEENQILQMAKDGYIIPEIVEQLKLNYGTIKSFINRNDINSQKGVRLNQILRPRNSRIKISWSIVAKLLNAKYTIRGIAKKLGINRESLRSSIHNHIALELLPNGIKRYKIINPGDKKPTTKIKFDKGKLKEENVIQIAKLYNTGNFTYKKLSKMFGVSCTAIQAIISGKKWKRLKLKIIKR